MSGLIWIQTVWHSDGTPERIFKNVNFEKKSADITKNHAKFPSMLRVNVSWLASDRAAHTIGPFIQWIGCCHKKTFSLRARYRYKKPWLLSDLLVSCRVILFESRPAADGKSYIPFSFIFKDHSDLYLMRIFVKFYLYQCNWMIYEGGKVKSLCLSVSSWSGRWLVGWLVLYDIFIDWKEESSSSVVECST